MRSKQGPDFPHARRHVLADRLIGIGAGSVRLILAGIAARAQAIIPSQRVERAADREA
ncbi:hypothetical protein [Sphingobium cloacae]|uniref:hypothetical protein n=1 Tax=Sphingobium cloacae TaxID=120107 RepID=UPI000A88C46F|nr:hypothetical protein [Sphingobium cloacae]